jgi:DNA-binding NtrC family response regulator
MGYDMAHGNRMEAARLLNVGKTTVYRKLREYGLSEADDVSCMLTTFHAP